MFAATWYVFHRALYATPHSSPPLPDFADGLDVVASGAADGDDILAPP